MGLVLAAGAIRVTSLDGLPAGLFRDEAEKGYNAWALATTGQVIEFTGEGTITRPEALRAHHLPFMVDVMGDRTSAIYHYAAVPFMWAAGLSVKTTRLPAAMAGTLTVLVLGGMLMGRWGPVATLATAAWLSLCPWHLVFSRWALQGIFVPLLMAVALWGLAGVERRRRWGWPLAGAALGLMFYAYSGAQPMVVAWAAGLAIIYRRRILPMKTWVALGAVLFLIPVLPTLWVRLSPSGSQRLDEVALWTVPGADWPRVIWLFVKHYLSHFDPRFLFLAGDPQPRHSVPGLGQLLIVDAVLVPVGMAWAFRRKAGLRWALLAALLLGPLPAALTRDGSGHGLRSIGMLVPAVAFSGAGLAWLAEGAKAALERRGGTQRRAAALTGLLVASILAMGLVGVARYWGAYRGPAPGWIGYEHYFARGHPAAHLAFQAGARMSWQMVAERRQPGEPVFVNATLPYAPYYQMFFLQPDPLRLLQEGLGSQGVQYFMPRGRGRAGRRARLPAGAWLIDRVDPRRVDHPSPEATPFPEAAIRRAGEGWAEWHHK